MEAEITDLLSRVYGIDKWPDAEVFSSHARRCYVRAHAADKEMMCR